MKKRSPAFLSTSVDMLEESTSGHNEGKENKIKNQNETNQTLKRRYHISKTHF